MRAYDEGGFTLWGQTAMGEVEAETTVVRVRRQRDG